MNIPDLSDCTDQEIEFFCLILYPFVNSQYIHPQHPFRETSTSRRRKIDFALITPESKIAIELDGFKYHARSQVTQKKFADDLQRQNELILAGWTVLRFSWRDFKRRPKFCQQQILEAIKSDIILANPYELDGNKLLELINRPQQEEPEEIQPHPTDNSILVNDSCQTCGGKGIIERSFGCLLGVIIFMFIFISFTLLDSHPVIGIIVFISGGVVAIIFHLIIELTVQKIRVCSVCGGTGKGESRRIEMY